VSENADRMKAVVYALVRPLLTRQKYSVMYACTVLGQAANLTLALKPDSKAVPSVDQVPIWHGIPGAKVKVANGARVLLGFHNSDPARPYAALWGQTTAVEIHFPASTLVSLGGENGTHPVILGDQLRTAQNALNSALLTALAAVNSYAVAVKAIADPTNVATPVLTTALVTAFGTAKTAYETAWPSYLSTIVKVKQ
jgi:hypothetical protein